MKKMMAMLLASVMVAGTFATTAFAYTGDDVQKNTSVNTAAQEADAAESANAGKTDNTDSIEIDPDMQVLPDGYEVSTDADGNLIVTVGGKEYNIGSEKSQKQMGTVVPGITSLHFRSGPGMDQEIIGYLHSGDTVEIVEKCGDWYKVNFNGKTGYAHGKYLNVTDSAKDSSMFSEDALKLFLDLMQGGMSSEDEKESSAALTPEGNMTLVDDIGEEEDKSSQQFITLVTKAGNTFYLIIDRDKDGNQNVHFLNMVSDIVALRQNGVVSCHYVDSIGFQELPGFLKPENYLKATEMAMEDDYGMIDGVINNGKKEEPVEKASVLDQLKEKQEAVPPAPPRRCCEEKEL